MLNSTPFVIIGGMKDDIKVNRLLKSIFSGVFLLIMSCCIFSCKEKKPEEKDIVKKPEQLEDRIRRNLQDIVEYSANNAGKINDTTTLTDITSIKSVYDKNGYTALWSANGKWIPMGDSLYLFIKNSKNYGLFPSDYYYNSLSRIRHAILMDSISAKDAALWSRADLMLTDALLLIAEHLKRGRLPYDSLTTRKDTMINENFYVNVLNEVVQSKQLSNTLEQLEPKVFGYLELKKSLPAYLDTTGFRQYTYLPYPFKDTAAFYSLLRNRLFEEKLFDTLPAASDTAALRKAIAKYQLSKNIKSTGKINENTIKSLDDTEWERYKRIAISMDKYKLLPDTMPPNYVWVNLPAYHLRVMDGDSIVMESKIIVGAPRTRTPELNAEISNFITYPQWTVPYSIIFKEMLPKIKKDTNYLKKQNLMVVDRSDSVISPSTIDWSKLSKKKFPYLLRQREGDDNSLGVLKFNFRNKYSVYLHDTNARWLFSKSSRALSHGCVRVQNWKELAHFLVRNDTIKYNIDTLANWIKRQEKHVVSGFKRMPLFIRYFTCEGVNGRVKFYDDIYAEDKMLAEKYYSKNIN